MKSQIGEIIIKWLQPGKMIIDHITEINHRTVIVFAAEERRLKDLTYIGKILDVFIVDNRDIIIKCFKRGRKHAGMRYETKQNDDADKADVT